MVNAAAIKMAITTIFTAALTQITLFFITGIPSLYADLVVAKETIKVQARMIERNSYIIDENKKDYNESIKTIREDIKKILIKLK